jgi:hypothetical protein
MSVHIRVVKAAASGMRGPRRGCPDGCGGAGIGGAGFAAFAHGPVRFGGEVRARRAAVGCRGQAFGWMAGLRW